MATNLNPVDVVMVGLGAANGIAVLPLTRAGNWNVPRLSLL